MTREEIQAKNDRRVNEFCKAVPEWSAPVREAHKKLTRLIPGYKVAQIKEKFGGLRYYIELTESHSDLEVIEANRIISEAAMAVDEINKLEAKRNGS